MNLIDQMRSLCPGHERSCSSLGAEEAINLAEQCTVYVVMKNDFPDSVWMDEKLAQRYIDEKNSQPMGIHMRIYWRVYPFTLKASL